MNTYIRNILVIIVLVISCILLLDLVWWAGAFLVATGLYGIAMNWKAYQNEKKRNNL
ncbi:hypothetical protein [Alteribacter lacisalsi]|uniref:hypothetical protein n=1 Tax=Alteribacter lacisalsi TaxID=2045244 RepID=UPI0013753299|nr:hypothetical protein [Alteribacter lacisalsi]